MEQKGKSWLEVSLQYGATSRNVGLSILFISEFEERGVRKVTTVVRVLHPGLGPQTDSVRRGTTAESPGSGSLDTSLCIAASEGA